MKIVLASASPRRREILSMVCDSFDVRISSASESYSDDTPLDQIPKILAERKALSVPMEQDEIIIGADTVVICEGELMGKPKSRQDAIRMLEKFSDNTHAVVSGICVRTHDKLYSESVTSYVNMRKISREEIEKYIDRDEPYDKAGAYGIQEMAGAFVRSIDGDFYNIVGLPLCRLTEIFKSELGVELI